MTSAESPEQNAAIARREIPWLDARVTDLSREHRDAAARTWLGRASGELQTAGTFTFLSLALENAGAPSMLVEMARVAIDDEQRHAAICHRMASIYAGRQLAMPSLRPVAIPAYRGASEGLRASLRVIGQCSINETTASAYLERCLDGSTDRLARSVLLELLRDEIEHAQIGWAHVSAMCESAGGRADLSQWLRQMLELNLARWRADLYPLPGDKLWFHGCPPAHEIDAAVLDGMRSVILPGFARAGVDVDAALEWCERLTPRPPAD